MKEGKCLITFVLLAATMVMPAGGAERSMPGTTPSKLPAVNSQAINPAQPVGRTPANLPDLVITSVRTQGGAYQIGERGGYPEEAVGVEMTIMNRGVVGISRGSSFHIGIHHDGQCVPDLPNCGLGLSAIGCGFANTKFVQAMSKSFHFSPSIQVNAPFAAGETRTIIGKLVLPQCLRGSTAQVYLFADDMRSQIEESNESNNKSALFSVTSSMFPLGG